MPLLEQAPAKINLTLRLIGRRSDGYHDIESLVAFAGIADDLTFFPGEPLALQVDGPTADQAGEIADNLVLKAARGLATRVPGLKTGRFLLTKRLPVAAGVGGGSSDAAAALRLLARVNSLRFDDARLIETGCATGADVPVCIDPRARIMRGIGDVLSAPLAIAKLAAVLVNPEVPVATKEIFGMLGLDKGEQRAARTADPVDLSTPDLLLAYMRDHANDLEQAAIALQPVIADALAALTAQSGCRIARMSGSGATCFGLFESPRAAEAAAANLARARPTWWVCPTTLG